MTRSSKLALVTLLAGLLSLASVATVDAGAPCTGYAQEHCAQMAAADDAIVYHVEAFAAVHTLAGTGIGQEHFEAMSATQVTAFSVAIPTPVRIFSCSGYAREHCEAMTAQIANP
jgi:hypothetical protein